MSPVRSTVLAALMSGGLAPGCGSTADPQQLKDVDALIASVEAALLTLGELDPGRHRRADSVFNELQGLFLRRFADTLDRATASRLGGHYLVLRAARAMGEDHERIIGELRAAANRLRALRNDIANGALEPSRAATALATERLAWTDLEANVHRIIDNYRTVQRVQEDLPALDSLLAHTP